MYLYLTDKLRIKISIQVLYVCVSGKGLIIQCITKALSMCVCNVYEMYSFGFMKFLLLFSWLTTTGVIERVVDFFSYFLAFKSKKKSIFFHGKEIVNFAKRMCDYVLAL